MKTEVIEWMDRNTEAFYGVDGHHIHIDGFGYVLYKLELLHGAN